MGLSCTTVSENNKNISLLNNLNENVQFHGSDCSFTTAWLEPNMLLSKGHRKVEPQKEAKVTPQTESFHLPYGAWSSNESHIFWIYLLSAECKTSRGC